MGNEALGHSYQHFIQFGFAWGYQHHKVTPGQTVNRKAKPFRENNLAQVTVPGSKGERTPRVTDIHSKTPMMEWDPPISFSSAVNLNIPIGMAGTAQEEGNAVFTGKLRGGGRARMRS